MEGVATLTLVVAGWRHNEEVQWCCRHRKREHWDELKKKKGEGEEDEVYLFYCHITICGSI